MKTTGATWKAYMESWPHGQWFDDSDETINGISGDIFDGEIPDDAVVEFSCGVVLTERNKEVGGLVSHFRAWLRAQTRVHVLCDVPRNKLGEFKALIAAVGAKVKS